MAQTNDNLKEIVATQAKLHEKVQTRAQAIEDRIALAEVCVVSVILLCYFSSNAYYWLILNSRMKLET